MKKANYIDPKDLANLEFNEDGTIKVPEGIIIYIQGAKEREYELREEIKRIEELVEPTEHELTEWGRSNHPYYLEQSNLNSLKEELNRLCQ